MFNFDDEIEKVEEQKVKCKLCHDTGKYWIHNRKIYYTCYACDAKNKIKKDEK